MFVESIGGTLVVGAIGYLAYTKIPEQMRVRHSIRSVIVKKGIAHMCMAGGKKIKIHPSVEYVLPKQYGYRVLVHLPDSINLDHFLARQEVFEHKVGYPIVFNVKGDVLFMDIVTTKEEVMLPSMVVRELTPVAPKREENEGWVIKRI